MHATLPRAIPVAAHEVLGLPLEGHADEAHPIDTGERAVGGMFDGLPSR